ncbi:uL22 family ribosomal protein [Pseudonocardia sp. H11422]|uniref:uL22 family ribosomal protein n=1 Tax=Pseudonocardia sp. H11422 TaxID=2835866 RepID=UPI001BDCC8BF|nr:uL22 family ribosomal protein [Pseudonocardia sp. H11422]
MEISNAPGLVIAEAPQARIDEAVAQRALDRVIGLPASEALAVLTHPGSGTCEPVARVVQGALAAARRDLGVGAGTCVVHAGEVGPGEPVTRVRRQVHGLATWITTQTTRIWVELRVPVLHLVTGAGTDAARHTVASTTDERGDTRWAR